jgi:hypothetical protein
MALLNSAGNTKLLASPIQKLDAGELDGRVKSIHDSFTLSAEMTVADEIDGLKIPEGARILSAEISISAALGAGTLLDLGLRATSDSSDNVVAEDQNSLVNQANTAAIVKKEMVQEAGYLLKLGSEAQCFVTLTGAGTTAGTGSVISYVVKYVLP